MSRLHEMIVKHRVMSATEKMTCNCEMCKGLNVHKSKRKIEIPTQKSEVLSELMIS